MTTETTIVINHARVRNWRFGNHSSYSGMLHDPETDLKVDWQDKIRKILWNLPEGAKVTITLSTELPAPGTVHSEDYWTLTSPHTYEHKHKQIQQECLEAVDDWQRGNSLKCNGTFSWPMDRLSNRGYTYDIHTAIVDAWNAEDRKTEIVEFHKAWLSDIGNIKAALKKRTSREQISSPTCLQPQDGISSPTRG